MGLECLIGGKKGESNFLDISLIAHRSSEGALARCAFPVALETAFDFFSWRATIFLYAVLGSLLGIIHFYPHLKGLVVELHGVIARSHGLLRSCADDAVLRC